MKRSRYLIKLSGEVLKGEQDSGISRDVVDGFSKRLAGIIKSGVQLGFVVGGGNIYRGTSGTPRGYQRLIGDQIGMLSTVLNGLTLVEGLKKYDIPVILQSGIKIEGVAGLFNKDKADEILEKGGTVIFCGGIGNPYFSTDTTSVLRALQIDAEFVFKTTKVDGIYDKDPLKNKDAKLYDTVTFDEMIQKKLGVMDLTALIMMKENGLKLLVFNMTKEGLLERACAGEKIGTIVER